MKKIYLTLISISIALISFSQENGFSDNKYLISGNLGGSTTFSYDSSSIEFTWKQKFGYFVSKNLNVGVGFEFGSSDGYSLDAFGKYYFTPQNRFSFFLGQDIKYITSTTNDVKKTKFGVSIYPGINYFLNKGLAIETSIGLLNYSTQLEKVNPEKTTNNFNLEMKLKTLNIGLVCSF
jgi:outer membrane protein